MVQWKSLSWFAKACWIIRAVVSLPFHIIRGFLERKSDRIWFWSIMGGLVVFFAAFFLGFQYPWLHTAIGIVVTVAVVLAMLVQIGVVLLFIAVFIKCEMEELGVRFR